METQKPKLLAADYASMPDPMYNVQHDQLTSIVPFGPTEPNMLLDFYGSV